MRSIKNTLMLATDRQNSVLCTYGASLEALHSYSTHGVSHPRGSDARSAFNGQWLEMPCHGYCLGNGQRLFLPLLRRFTQPDTMSPFNAGGLNAYAYCLGDPVNHKDPSGHVPVGAMLSLLRIQKLGRSLLALLPSKVLAPSLTKTVAPATAGIAKVTATQAPLEQLPLEVFDNITRYLDVKSLHQLAASSKTLQTKVAQNSAHHMTVYLNELPRSPYQGTLVEFRWAGLANLQTHHTRGVLHAQSKHLLAAIRGMGPARSEKLMSSTKPVDWKALIFR